jgi:hypothetical protein
MNQMQPTAGWRVRAGHLCALALLAALVLAGLWPDRTVQAAPRRQTTAPPSLTDLRNATYRSLNAESGTVQLSDGRFEDPAGSLTVRLTDFYAIGDIDGDEVADAVVVLATETGGTGTFISLAGLVNVEGGLQPAGVVLLGDRVRVSELSIVNGLVRVDYLRQGTSDPLCCPTQEASGVYALRRGLLVPQQTQAFGFLFPFQEGDLYGYANILGETVIEPQFVQAGEFAEGFAAVSYDGVNTGYINQLGELVIDPRFSYGGAFHQGLAIVGVPGVDADKPFLSAFIDRDGRFVFGDARYVTAEPFREGLAAVSLDGERFGYINLRGEMVIEPQYPQAESFSEGLAPVQLGDRYGFIDRTGQFIIEPQYDAAEPFSDGRAQISLEEKVGYINHRGDIVIEPIFDYGSHFAEGRALVSLEGKPLYIDEFGNPQIELATLTSGSDFSEGLAAVVLGDQYGYIDLQGDVVIAPQFSYAGSFRNGLALFETPEVWGVINNIGEVVLEMPKFEQPAMVGTEVIDYVPALPEAVRPGRCSEPSALLGIATAWRCTVEDQSFDPCLVGEDGETVVCAIEPSAGGTAFRVELTEPLPEATILAKPLSPIWQLQLSDGALCTLVSGLNVTVDEGAVTHTCSDGDVLLGAIEQGEEPWTVTKATLVNDEAGNYTAESTETVSVVTAWQPATPEE